MTGLAPLHVEHNADTTRVVPRDESGPLEVIVGEQLSELLLSTCGSRVAVRVRTYALVSVTSA